MLQTNTPPHADLSIAGVPLSFVTEAKILGFKIICSGIRILMRSPRKPIKNCTFSGWSRGLDSMMMSSCLFTNAMSDPLLNMLMLLGLPLSLRNRGKFCNTCKNARAQPSYDSATLHMRLLWRPVGLSFLLRGGKVIVVGLPKGSPILNVQITSSLLPDWSLTPTTCVLQVITLNCASEHHASKTVQSHTLSTS